MRATTAATLGSLLIGAIAAALALSACGGGGGDTQTGIEAGAGQSQVVTEEAGHGDAGHGEVRIDGTGERTAEEIERAALDYLGAIDDRDAAGVCGLLAPGALEGMRLRGGAGCASRLQASIGRPPSKAAPRWRGTEVLHPTRVSFSGGRGRVTVEVLHRFARGGTPSLEDDVVYLVRGPGGWLVVKPSATLYRAVGYPSPPLDALTPPQSSSAGR